MLILSIDQALRMGAETLSPWEKDDLRDAGYQFDEDLDNVPELFRNMGDEDNE